MNRLYPEPDQRGQRTSYNFRYSLSAALAVGLLVGLGLAGVSVQRPRPSGTALLLPGSLRLTQLEEPGSQEQDRPKRGKILERLRNRLDSAVDRNADPDSRQDNAEPADYQTADPGGAAGLNQPASYLAPLVDSPQIVSSEAVIGTQYNVGHLVFRLAPEDMVRWQSRAIFVSDPEGRIQFPVIMPTLMERLTSQVADQTDPQPSDINVWFLFTGRQPLEVVVHAHRNHTKIVVPEAVRRLRQRLVTQNWWRQFHSMLEEQSQASDYPALVQAYLGTMVQQRMGMELPLLQRQKEKPIDPMTATWYLLTGAEDLQVESMRQLMTGQADTGVANLPLPANIAWQAHQYPLENPDVEIESIARVVPHECFYLRFGTWSNQIWLKQLLEEHGGDLSRMVRLRGYQSMVGDVFRDQLALHSSQLDDMLGGTLIQDVAVIGLDTFFNDGAAAGIVFQGKNGLLRNNMNQKRKEFARQHQELGVTLSDVMVGTTPGTLLQSPDGKVRSLMVTSDNYVFITTSFTLAQRFLESSGQGVRTLADSSEFQFARTQMPLSRDDTIFVYFSTAFLENLLSPHYQIELKRRLRSITEIQALQLASWSAAAQGVPAPDNGSDWDYVALSPRITALKASGLLPGAFNLRPDGSQLGLMRELDWDQYQGDQIEPREADDSESVAPGPLETLGATSTEESELNLEGPAAKKSGSGSLLGSLSSILGGGKKKTDTDGEPRRLQSVQEDAEPLPGEPATVNRETVDASNRQATFENTMGRSPVGGLIFGDTHRGVRGWMVPVADMPLNQVTADEQAWYKQRAQYFAENWGQTDPIMIGIKRFRLDDAKERVVFDGRVAPFGSNKYAWLTDSIGPPMQRRPAKSPDDVIRLEVSIAEGALLNNVGAHQLFASIQRDAQQLSSIDPGEWWTTLKLIQDTPGYIGSWPTAGWLNMLPMLGGRPDDEGFTHSIGRRIWRMQHEGFSVVATTRERLEQLKPFLQMVDAEYPAQVRLEVSDLNESQLAGWTNALWRQRSWQASVANTRLLHLLMQHFRLDPREARQKAQSLLNARLVCSLDGEYRLRGPATGIGPPPMLIEEEPTGDPLQYFWVSDRWPADNIQAAEKWSQEQSPLLKWFRGALLEVLQEDQRFLVHGYLDIKRDVKETAALPGFNLFDGFSFK